MDWNEILDRIEDAEHPVSLCEVVTDEECAEILREVQNGEVWRCLELGLKLMCAFVYVARREATGGRLWDCLYRNVEGRIATSLFTSVRQPTEDLKYLIEKTCRDWNLRHVFGETYKQRWYDTIHLQFGFTHASFKDQLANWLVGLKRAEAVEQLLENHYLRSESFRTLWNAFEQFRRDRITPESLRKIIRKSPWVLSEWEDELVIAAGEKRTRQEGHLYLDEQENVETSFLGNSRLNTSKGLANAYWEIALDGADELKFTEQFYQLDIFTGNQSESIEKKVLQRQDNGSYSNTNRVFEISLDSVVDGSLVVKITNSKKEFVCEEEVLLYNPDEDIIAFSPRGIIRPDFTKKENRPGSYVLMIRDDLTIDPEPSEWRHFQKIGYKLLPVQLVEAQTLRIVFADDGEELWSSKTGLNLKINFPDSIRPRCVLPDTKVLFDPTVTELALQISRIPQGMQITVAHWRSHKLNIQEIGELWFVSGVPKMEALLATKIDLKLKIRDGEMLYIGNVICELDAAGITQNKSTFVPKFEAKSTSELEHYNYHVFLPRSPAGTDDKWNLFEGERHLQNVRSKDRLLHSGFAGYGEKLCLRQRLFNSTDECITLIEEINDQGFFCIDNENPSPGKDFEFKVWTSPEFDQNYQIHYGAIGAEPVTEPTSKRLVLDNGIGFFSPFPETPCDYLVLTYNDARMAAWWRKQHNGQSWSSNLRNIHTDEEAHRAAFIMRWAKLPILSRRYLEDVKIFFEKFSTAILAEWYPSERSSGDRKIDADRENHEYWLNVIQRISGKSLQSIREIAEIPEGWYPESVLKYFPYHNSSILTCELLGKTNSMDSVDTLRISLISNSSIQRKIIAAKCRDHILDVTNGCEVSGIPLMELLKTEGVEIEIVFQQNTVPFDRTNKIAYFRTKLTWRPITTGIVKIVNDKSTFARSFETTSIYNFEAGDYQIFASTRSMEWYLTESGKWHLTKSGKWYLCEGKRFLKRIEGSCDLKLLAEEHKLAGYGEELSLKSKLYEREDQIVLVRELTDQRIYFQELDNTDSVEKKLSHDIFYGAMTGKVNMIRAGDYLPAEIYSGLQNKSYDYLAFVHNGVCVASHWKADDKEDSWSKSLREIQSEQEAANAAFTIRWAKLPLLSKHHFPDVLELYLKFPSVVLREWLYKEGSVDGHRKVEGEITDFWHDAVRRFTSDYTVNKSTFPVQFPLDAILYCLASNARDKSIESIAETLHRIGVCDPILMGRLLNYWIDTSHYISVPLYLNRNLRKIVSAPEQHFVEMRSALKVYESNGGGIAPSSKGAEDNHIPDGTLQIGLDLINNLPISEREKYRFQDILSLPKYRKGLYHKIIDYYLPQG